MLNNNIPIGRIIGIAVLGLTVMIFSFFIQEMAQNSRFERLHEDEILILGVSFLAFLTGIGLVFLQKWARVLLVIVMGLSLFFWLFGVVFSVNMSSRQSISLYGTTIFLVSFAMTVSLVLFNSKVGKDFGDNEVIRDFEDTIDGDFFEE